MSHVLQMQPGVLNLLLPPTPQPSDDSAAFLAAVANATAEAEVSGKGVAVLVPPGDYRLTKKITISSSRVVLRGAGVSGMRGAGWLGCPAGGCRWMIGAGCCRVLLLWTVARLSPTPSVAGQCHPPAVPLPALPDIWHRRSVGLWRRLAHVSPC